MMSNSMVKINQITSINVGSKSKEENNILRSLDLSLNGLHMGKQPTWVFGSFAPNEINITFIRM